MSGGRETENVDVAFELILEAAEEYEKFLMGLPEGNIITDILAADSVNIDQDERNILRSARNVLSKIMDRTAGAPRLDEIGSILTSWPASAGTIHDVISVTHIGGSSKSGKYSIPEEYAKSGLAPGTSNLDLEYKDFKDNEIKHVVRYIDPARVSKRTVLDANTEEGSAENQSGETKRTVSIPSIEKSEISLTEVPPDAFNNTSGFSRKNPNLGTIVLKDSRFSFNSRSANHMPVFLSAISPIEMSRCSPYLDVKIITNQKTKANKLGIYNFIRASAEEKTNSETTFFNPKAVKEEFFPDNEEKYFYNYMDLFASPQTMVNANINKEERGSIFNRRSSRNTNDNSVNDPFQPFMTLLGFNVSISGIGHGLLATKSASLRIKLHDKTRIKDISSFLSPNEFGFTKFSIEIGWSHPDGGVNSNNTIGRYLNALRDVSIYQLKNADYSFGDDNSVDINLHLVCSGFNQMSSVSAAAGNMIGLSSISERIEDILEKVILKQSIGLETESEMTARTKEIRGKMRITNSDLKSKGSLAPFEKVLQFESDVDNFYATYGESAQERDEILKRIFEIVYNFRSDNGTDGNSLTVDQMAALVFAGSSQIDRTKIDEASINAGDIIYAKLASLKYGIDPFRGQVSSNFSETLAEELSKNVSISDVKMIGAYGLDASSYNSAPDHVSLGKIITSFIGYPMATSLQFSEVQLVFYPVNTQSGAASKHTTASLPIDLKALEKEIEKRVLASETSFRNLSVQAFFTMLDRIVSNFKLSAYGLYSSNDTTGLYETSNTLDLFLQKSHEEKFKEAEKELNNIDQLISEVEQQIASQVESSSTEITEETKKRYTENAIIAEYEKQLREVIGSRTETKIKNIYDIESPSDSSQFVKNKFLDRDRFTPINLSMFFETAPAKSNAANTDLSQIRRSVGNILQRRDITNRGLDLEKSILRIHIYDENSTMNPGESLQGTDFRNSNGQNLEFSSESLSSYNFVKHMIMSRNPTIIHGSSTGVVNSIKVQSNTASDLSNILMVESYAQSNEGEQEVEEGFDETVLIPTTVNLELMGFPMLSRGQQIFIDFGTQTSLDNLYMVKTVEHSIEPGSFKTNAVLTATNQMVVTSYRNRLQTLIKSATS